jgi:Mg-chelatase subunit ChlD
MRSFVLAVLLLARAARADDHEPLRDQTPRRVTAVLVGGSAHVTARFELKVVPLDRPSLVVELDLPRHGVITGAVATLDGVAHPLAIVTAEQSQQAFEALYVPGRKGPRPWAISIDGDDQALTGPRLIVTAPRRGVLIVDVEIEAPTCVYRDARYLAVPETWSRNEGTPALGEACGFRKEDGSNVETHWLRFSGPQLSLLPSGEARVVSDVERLSVPSADFARVELQLARELADVPADLHTVFVVDSSRSVGVDERAARDALIASYLDHAPRTQVQLVGFARTAQALLPGWTTTDGAGARIKRELRTLVPRNGSNLDAGLREAATWLAHAPGTHRVIVFTDERMSDHLVANVASLAALLPHDTLVHIVGFGTGELARDDAAELAPLAAATGGTLVHGGVLENGRADATPLVRPVALDHVVIHAADWTHIDADSGACGERIVAGTSCVWWAKGLPASGAVVIDGQLWGKPVHRTVTPDTHRTRTVARELSVAVYLDEKLRKEVERAALAVNSTWSLLGTWGGQGSYPEDEQLFGGLAGSICGCDPVGTYGRSVGSGHLRPDLAPQLAPLVAACHPGTDHVAIDLELTLDEIVDVRVTGGTPALRTCVTEAAWNLALALPDPVAHMVVTTKL